MAEHGIWMPIYWGDYLGKTSCLSCEEHGAYLLLIAAYWQRGRALPDEDRFLATATRLTLKKWKIMRPKIIEYFREKDGHLTHERVEFEILRSCERISSGKAGANARWHADAMPSTSTPTKEEDIKSFSNGKVLGSERVTIKDPKERLDRFQRWLAGELGRDGWIIVAAANDPSDPDYLPALIRCQETARSHKKGWPHQWPKAQ